MVAALGALAGRTKQAAAAPVTTTSPSQLTNNNYSLEFFQGPVLASNRVTGLAGAYTAVAEGTEGASVNAAAPAVRQAYSTHWFDYDIDLGISFPGAYGGTDYDNRGDKADPTTVARVNHFLHGEAGLALQFGELGVSVTTELLQYSLTSAADPPSLSYVRGHVLAGYGFFHNQIVLGAGVRIVALQLTDGGLTGKPLITMAGVSPEAGIVWKPQNYNIRFGGTARAPVSASALSSDATTDAMGVRRASGFILPTNVVQPWELEGGMALQLGPRPLNPPFVNPRDRVRTIRQHIERARAFRAREMAAALTAAPASERPALQEQLHREEAARRLVEEARASAAEDALVQELKARYANWPRERILLVASLLIAGASSNAVAIEGFLNQNQERVGESVSIMPRVGLESEPIPNWVSARAGTYIEASRFSDGNARQHFTFGADVKLIHFSPWGIFGDKDQVWRVSGVADLAPRYSNIGLAVGNWH